MDLRKLRHFVVLAEELNFSRAAEKVHLTQSALSRSIFSLEQVLGARLFDRSNNNVLLTPVGKILLKRAQSLLLDLGSLKQEVHLMAEGETGDISMGVGPFPGSILMPSILTELVREKPRVRVDVEINNPRHLLEHLLHEQIEFFVADLLAIPPDARTSIRPLGRLYLGLVARAAHPLVQKGEITPSDIVNYPLVAVRMSGPLLKAILQYLGVSEEKELRLSVVCDNPTLLEFVTRNSDAIAITTIATGHREIENGYLAVLPTAKHPDFFSELGVVSLKGRTQSPSALWLIERIRELTSELASSMPTGDANPPLP